jgi:hypothetical protein
MMDVSGSGSGLCLMQMFLWGSDSEFANFENNAGQYGTNNQTSHVVSGEQKMQEFSQNLHGFNPSENVHNSEDYLDYFQIDGDSAEY